MTRWVTIEKAAESTGLPVSFIHERTGLTGHWPEDKVWKWFEGRKLLDLEALYKLIDQRPSVPSKRGRRRSDLQCQDPKPKRPAPA
nr:hypothetical protein [uncultured Albidiferax sp.]